VDSGIDDDDDDDYDSVGDNELSSDDNSTTQLNSDTKVAISPGSGRKSRVDIKKG
jgi:hypothetical protein